MDNLRSNHIVQYNFDTDDGVIVITCLSNKNNEEYWAHCKGYGIMIFLCGHEHIKNTTLEEMARFYSIIYYDQIIDTKGD